MSPPNRVGANPNSWLFDSLIPPVFQTALISSGPGSKANLRVADNYLSNERDKPTGVSHLTKPVKVRRDPREDSVKWLATEGALFMGGSALLLTQWDSEGLSALGGFMVGAGLTGGAIEILEDYHFKVKLPTWYKIGAPAFFGSIGAMTALTLRGFSVTVPGDDKEFPMDEYGKRQLPTRQIR